ncbi:hypothetical protein DSCO28_55140 [Desulfosarcina ovata subsp. sediminis]|uniref:Sigma-54 factor interaction domain-containing protein n=1 Tax=Desulfosarcina ovata subsp. sediminis TaxID=885957 RepID=A0A5K7ZXJ3_9BACT|nr:helix-turn-helix domain-containing protein [Desulfosarcina ovata]BBO84948.1 hypothetical protein DSCO28_55140 [Desulfosarcina ovata subsp. sediminis]
MLNFSDVRTHLIQIPPLRERAEDMAPLVAHLARRAASQMGKTITAIDKRLLRRLASMPFSELSEYAVDKALETAGNNQSEAARTLGISKQALNKRLKKGKI